MIDKTPLSDAVRTVCSRHFDGNSRGCSKCPIREACHSSPNGWGLTFDNMEAWRLRLNAAAASATSTIAPEGDKA